jgi:hypothetical protein
MSAQGVVADPQVRWPGNQQIKRGVIAPGRHNLLATEPAIPWIESHSSNHRSVVNKGPTHLIRRSFGDTPELFRKVLS